MTDNNTQKLNIQAGDRRLKTVNNLKYLASRSSLLKMETAQKV